MSGDLRTRLERERDVLEHLVYHPCPCPRTTPVPEVAAVTAIIDHLARVLDAYPDTPTPDAPECCASGRCEVCSPGFDWARNGALPDAFDRASDDSDALLVEQLARVLCRNVAGTIPCEVCVQRARALVVARPWQAEVDAARTLHRDLVSRLGFGNDITEPMADNDTVVAWFEEQGRDAAEWREHESWRNACIEAGHPDTEDCWEHDPSLRLEAAEAEIERLRGEVEAARQDAHAQGWDEGYEYRSEGLIPGRNAIGPKDNPYRAARGETRQP